MNNKINKINYSRSWGKVWRLWNLEVHRSVLRFQNVSQTKSRSEMWIHLYFFNGTGQFICEGPVLWDWLTCSIHTTLSWIIQCLKSIAFTWLWDFACIYGQKHTYRLSNTCYDLKCIIWFMHNEVFFCLLWMYCP